MFDVSYFIGSLWVQEKQTKYNYYVDFNIFHFRICTIIVSLVASLDFVRYVQKMSIK